MGKTLFMLKIFGEMLKRSEMMVDAAQGHIWLEVEQQEMSNLRQKQGNFYTSDLSASDEIFHIPTEKKQKDVQTTVQNSINSGDSPDTRVEYGGHSIKGEENAYLWDPGIPTQTYKTPDGYTVLCSIFSAACRKTSLPALQQSR